MKAIIWLVVDSNNYKYGEYEYSDEIGMNLINEIAKNVQRERNVPTWVERVKESEVDNGATNQSSSLGD